MGTSEEITKDRIDLGKEAFCIYIYIEDRHVHTKQLITRHKFNKNVSLNKLSLP